MWGWTWPGPRGLGGSGGPASGATSSSQLSVPAGEGKDDPEVPASPFPCPLPLAGPSREAEVAHLTATLTPRWAGSKSRVLLTSSAALIFSMPLQDMPCLPRHAAEMQHYSFQALTVTGATLFSSALQWKNFLQNGSCPPHAGLPHG